MRPRAIAVGVAALVLAGAAGPAGAAAIRLDGWGTISADMGGGALVWSDAAAAKTKTFTYWRTDTGRAVLSGSRLGRIDHPVTVRTSAGPAIGAAIRASGAARGLVLVAPGASYAGPVIWCCTTSGTEVVVESDGRGDAPRPIAATLDGTRVRWIGTSPAGAVLAAGDPVEGAVRATSVAFPGNPVARTASLARGLVAWADAGGSVLNLATPTDEGVTDARAIPQGGRVIGVWAAPGVVATAVRAGGRVRVTWNDPVSGTHRVVWRGSRTPKVAVGGRAIAIGTGSKVLTSRGGTTARAAGDARGPVAAVATDGSRVAVFERITRTVTEKRHVRRVKTTRGRIIGGVR